MSCTMIGTQSGAPIRLQYAAEFISVDNGSRWIGVLSAKYRKIFESLQSLKLPWPSHSLMREMICSKYRVLIVIQSNYKNRFFEVKLSLKPFQNLKSHLTR